MGVKKRRISNLFMPTETNAPKKLEPKTMRILSIFVYVHFFMVFVFNFC
jgi:hypothetical protein